MASSTLIPVSEYLASSYQPDRDYIAGELQERNVGERQHGLIQHILDAFFYNNRRTWETVTAPELRVQVSPDRYRIPDICVLRRSDPADDIVRKAPLICIEILSPEDRVQRVQERVDDYLHMGVENIWIVDPLSRHAWSVQPDGSHQHVTDAFIVPGSPIRIALAEVFAELDDMQSGASQ